MIWSGLSRRPWLAVGVVTAMAAAASCGGGEDEAAPTPPPGPTTTAATTEGPPATAPTSAAGAATITVTVTDDDVGDDAATPAFPADTDPDTSEPAGPQLLFTDLRVGHHEGFDRVVWEFAGDGTPGWRVQYVDEVIRDPSGLPLELSGDAALSVVVMNVGIPGDVDVPPGSEFYDGPPLRAASSTEWVTEVFAGDLFEAYLVGFVGVVDELPFRVYALDGPPRVVVEVRGD
ncbi:MAG: hypothetical protein ACFCVG_08410 [Kineosporiaceae bacterium]